MATLTKAFGIIERELTAGDVPSRELEHAIALTIALMEVRLVHNLQELIMPLGVRIYLESFLRYY